MFLFPVLVASRIIADATSTDVAAILTSPEARSNYLAHARLWREPGTLSPQDILDGPRGVFAYTFEDATTETHECTFARPGKELGGETPKFLCRTGDGGTLRVKYWDLETRRGNREVFAMVAATRLLWALGFNAQPALPINIRCLDCPTDPMSGSGPRAARRYLGELQAYPLSGPWILSSLDRDEGWSWQTLDEAIARLPGGPERTQQRAHFDALTLLGVFMQHGDRKPSQHALYCAGSVDVGRGEIRRWEPEAGKSLLLEPPDASSCAEPAAMIVDAGATFGGGGRLSSAVTAKMNLDQWRGRSVFREHSRPEGTCRGRLTVSMAAGREGEGDPLISEDGRQFLLQQLQRLTGAHIRALFSAAQVGTLHNGRTATPPEDGIDEWVDVFQAKVNEIAAHRCRPAS